MKDKEQKNNWEELRKLVFICPSGLREAEESWEKAEILLSQEISKARDSERKYMHFVGMYKESTLIYAKIEEDNKDILDIQLKEISDKLNNN